jgi:glycosyltransferase involved in cell wall biosynthesis
MTYLNIGHTGLEEPSLPRWILQNELRAIYLIHDVIPLTHPEYCRQGEAAKHRQRMKNALASASGVITNSRYTRDELARFASSEGMHMPASVEAWLGVEAMKGQSLAHRNDPPYFVTVGTIEARKNHLLLLEVWDRLLQSMDGRTPQLLIVGSRGWEAKKALQRLDRLGPLDGYVREINGCTDQELASWIAGARGLLMPSFVEGFGLPVIEALSLGTPVIASNLSVFREIAGDIPTYLSPTDTCAWEMTVRSFCEDCRERERQVSRIAAYEPPSWDDHFRIVDEWLGRLSFRPFAAPNTIEG